jgi:ferredoxin
MSALPKYPTIEIDVTKCTTPFACKACLQVCPQAVFGVHVVKVARGKETDPNDPGAYNLDTRFRDKCTGCMECLRVCPVDALKITFPEA